MKNDETLVRDYQQGDTGALEDLFRRYQGDLWHFARGLSWYRDKLFIDDIIQMVWATILKGIKKNGKFTPAGEGSFKGWAYKICQNICWNVNKKRAREAKPVSERYPEKVPDDLRAVRSQPTKDYHNLRARLYKLLQRLSPEDQQLILLKEDKTYKEIQQIPPFNKYTLVKLRQKVCRIRQWMIRLRKEERNDSENK